MEKRIQEFIADYIPKRISKETRYKLQYELESHIYDRIDYYTEIGYTEEECLEKALNDFGNDEETKKQIKNELGGVHRPFTMADFFYISIPVTIAIIFIGGTLLNFFLFTSHDAIGFLIIPLAIWLLIIPLKKTNKIHHIVKSIIAFILVVPYFIYMMIGSFFFTQTYDINLNKDEVVAVYKENITLDTEDEKYSFYFPPPSNKLGEPIDACYFAMGWETIFGDSNCTTTIFEYSPTEYKELKNKLNKDFEYMEEYEGRGYYIDDDYIDEQTVYNCNFKVYGFDFRTIEKEDDSDEYYEYWYLIGTNDETHEIAYIETFETTPTFDEYFIKEDCGWRYFYYKRFINN